MNFDRVLNSNFAKNISGEFITSMVTMLLIIIFSFVVYFKQKKYKPTDTPKGIVHLAEILIGFGDKQINSIMGYPKYFENFAGYIIPLALYIFIGFMIGMMGFPQLVVIGPASEGYLLNETKLFTQVPNPFTNLAFTMSIGLLTVFWVQFFRIRTQKWSYWKSIVVNLPPFLPLATNFVPMISLGMRLFGNAFSGFAIMTLVYGAMSQIGNGFGLIASPFVMPFLHAYFDLFSGFIQTLVFIMVTMMDIAQEAPETATEEKIAKTVTLKASMQQD